MWESLCSCLQSNLHLKVLLWIPTKDTVGTIVGYFLEFHQEQATLDFTVLSMSSLWCCLTIRNLEMLFQKRVLYRCPCAFFPRSRNVVCQPTSIPMIVLSDFLAEVLWGCADCINHLTLLTWPARTIKHQWWYHLSSFRDVGNSKSVTWERSDTILDFLALCLFTNPLFTWNSENKPLESSPELNIANGHSIKMFVSK